MTRPIACTTQQLATAPAPLPRLALGFSALPSGESTLANVLNRILFGRCWERRFLTGALEETSKDTGVSTAFLSFIVLPIAGNACEHITAVVVAAKDKMDLSLGIAIGSSLQVRGKGEGWRGAGLAQPVPRAL